jgi:hypothetical protein
LAWLHTVARDGASSALIRLEHFDAAFDLADLYGRLLYLKVGCASESC